MMNVIEYFVATELIFASMFIPTFIWIVKQGEKREHKLHEIIKENHEVIKKSLSTIIKIQEKLEIDIKEIKYRMEK